MVRWYYLDITHRTNLTIQSIHITSTSTCMYTRYHGIIKLDAFSIIKIYTCWTFGNFFINWWGFFFYFTRVSVIFNQLFLKIRILQSSWLRNLRKSLRYPHSLCHGVVYLWQYKHLMLSKRLTLSACQARFVMQSTALKELDVNSHF